MVINENAVLNIDFNQKSKSVWISDESSSGVKYDNINTKEDLLCAVKNYIDMYV